MPVGLSEPKDLLPVPGVRLASAYSGIKAKAATDTVLIELNESATVAGVFTKNAFCAAPVTVCKKHLEQGSPRALLINSGNANAGTGEPGMKAALTSCRIVAEALDVAEDAVLPFSTGVIGQLLPADKFADSMPGLVTALAEDSWLLAANAIRTTDTIAKAVSRQVHIDGKTVTITGMSKGAGMICPNMATMLAYVATDAVIPADTLQTMLTEAVDGSFNSITVDSDTSTNDACMLIASGESGVEASDDEAFRTALLEVFQYLAQAIVRDGEGATKFVTVKVSSAASIAEARQVAYTVAHSPLVKTALFASDANWGRILAAVGRAGIDDLDIDQVSIHLGEVCIVSGGSVDAAYTEEQGAAEMAKEEITIGIGLGRGDAQSTVWTSDLSHEYVRINAEYRT